MTLERASINASVIDVLDHVLDKGIVIDAWVQVSLVGIDLVTIEARVVVASIETYLNYSGTLPEPAARPALRHGPALKHAPALRHAPALQRGRRSVIKES